MHWSALTGVLTLACIQDERSGNTGSPVSAANGTGQPDPRERQAGLAGGWRSGLQYRRSGVMPAEGRDRRVGAQIKRQRAPVKWHPLLA